MNLKSIKFSLENGVGKITLTQPERGNPLDGRLSVELRHVAEDCMRRPEVRAILIDAEGPYFSVGGDLKSLAKDRNELPTFVANTLRDTVAAIATLVRGNAPIVASVHGIAAGGAVGLIAACDFILAAPDVSFVSAFSAIGLCADTGCAHYLPRRVGIKKATEFFLLGETWTARTALENELINRIVPADSLASEARQLAERLAKGPTLGFGETRRLLGRSMSTALEDQLAFEAAAIGRLVCTQDAWEGITGMLAKRSVTFAGK